MAEKSTFRFSHAKLIALGSLVTVILVGCSLALAKTLLASWLNPAYIEERNSQKIIELSAVVDTLEEQANQQRKFIALLQSTITGEDVAAEEPVEAEREQAETVPAPYSPEELAAADTLLRSEFEDNEASLLITHNKPVNDLQELFFFSPVNGIITTPFSHGSEHYGVDIVAKESEPIKCVADGMVIFAAWTVETGWVMVIQHNKDLVSIYKHNAALLKKVGTFVEAGEVISIMGNSGELSTGPHLHFELWYEGGPINPEHFITF